LAGGLANSKEPGWLVARETDIGYDTGMSHNRISRSSTPGLSHYLRELEERGYSVEKARRRSHWKVLRDGYLVTVIASSPSSSSQVQIDAERNIRRWENNSLGSS
jgi:hypothetical protein